jgi:tape measure domain-containing protein
MRPDAKWSSMTRLVRAGMCQAQAAAVVRAIEAERTVPSATAFLHCAAQVLYKGVLHPDDFRSLLGHWPAFLTHLCRYLGLDQWKTQQLAINGHLSTQAIRDCLLSLGGWDG